MQRVVIAVATVAMLAASGASTADINKPNFLIFVADDAGWEEFGAYGHPTVKTGTIDALAEAGWTADNAFLTTPQCSPSRISVLTGKYPHMTGAEDLHMPMPPEHTIVPSHLREAGYFTGNMLKQHFGPHAASQFDWYANDLVNFPAFLDEAGSRPFLLWVGFSDPHRPYGDAPAVHAPQDVRLPPTVIDNAATRSDYVQYYDELARMDAVIRGFLAELDRRDLRENTYIVFFSDNGSPMPRAKGTLYDSGIKTPLIIAGPGIAKGSRFEPLVSIIDLAPTILDWAGVAKPSGMVGESIAPQVSDPALPGRRLVFSERNWHNSDEHMRSVRTDRFKLIWNNYIELPHGTAADITSSPSWQALREARDNGTLNRAQSLLFQAPRPRVEFYDLDADPNEIDNLAAQPEQAEKIRALMASLETWMKDTKDFPPNERRRDDNVDRISGVKYTNTNPPFITEGGDR